MGGGTSHENAGTPALDGGVNGSKGDVVALPVDGELTNSRHQGTE
jgi:hypothetical protein